MINLNAGKKIPLPPRMARAQAQPPQPPPSAAAAKVISSIEERVRNVDLRPPAQKNEKLPGSVIPRRREKDWPSWRDKNCKGIYFDSDVYEALIKIKKDGMAVSKFVNKVVRKELGL